MPIQRWERLCAGRRGSVAKTCSAVPGSRHPSVVADRAGLVTTSFLTNRSDSAHSFAGTPGPSRQPVGLMMNYVHSAASIAHKEAKARMKGKKKDVATISQRAGQIVKGAHTKEKEDVACPRCDRELCVFNTASGPILRCRGWTLAGSRVAEYQPYRRWRFSEWFWLPRNTPRTRRWHTPPTNDWTAQVQALAANPTFAQEQFAQWQLLHRQCQHLQYQQQLVASSTTDPWQVLPDDGESTGDRWSMDTGTDRIGVKPPNPERCQNQKT